MHRLLIRLVCVVACLGAMVVAPGRALAQEIPALSERVTRVMLECGIEIVVYEQEDEESEAGGRDEIQVWTRIHRGSMTEMDHERGASVVAARAIMGGVGELTGDDLQQRFGVDGDKAYAGSHALVMGDHVVIQLGVMSDDEVVMGLELARGLVDGYEPGDESIEQARAALLGELDEIEKNRVEQKMHQRWLPALLPKSDYGKLPIPDREQCASLSGDAVRGFIAREWTPGQSSVLIVGDVDANVVIEQARMIFDGCEDRAPTGLCRGVMIDPSVNGHVVAMNEPMLESSRLGLVCFGGQEPIEWENGGFDEQLIQMMAGEAMRYRVSRMLRRDFPEVLNARVDVGVLMGRVGFGQIVVELSGPEDGGRWDAVLAGMEQERLRLMRDGLSDREIDRARGWTLQQLGYEVDQWNSASTRERARAMNWMLSMDRPLVDLESWIGGGGEVLGGVEKTRVDEELRRMFGEGDPAVLVLLDGQESASASEVRGVLNDARGTDISALSGDWIDSMRGPILSRYGRGGRVDEITMHQASGTMTAQLSNGVVVHHRGMVDPDEPGAIVMSVRLGFSSIESKEMHGAGDVFVAAMKRGMIRSRTESEIRGIMIEHGIEMEIAHYQDPLFKPKGWAID